MKSEKRCQEQHEPTADGDEWVECSGQRLWVAGFTEAGFPYGLTEEEFRQASARTFREAGWARAKRAMAAVLERTTDTTVDVGNVTKVGDGLSREVFAASVERGKGAKRERIDVAVLLPRPGCDRDLDRRTRKEVYLLGQLGTMDLPFRIPRVFGVHPDGDQLALVRSYESGQELDLRAGRQDRVRPWETVGKVAAAVHRITPIEIPSLAPRYATRLDHARAVLGEFDDTCEPELTDAQAWMQEHLPPPTPSTLVHGDLLGQNILLGQNMFLGIDQPDTVIDWEYAEFGDPAYDLAVVTRGVRRPFQIGAGLERLLEAYARAGGDELTRANVYLHELGLAARWYADALCTENPHASQESLQFLRGILRRATGRGG